MNPDPRHSAGQYTYKTFWSEPDKKFVGTCVDMPGLSHLDTDADGAAQGIRDLVQFVIEELLAATPLSLPMPKVGHLTPRKSEII